MEFDLLGSLDTQRTAHAGSEPEQAPAPVCSRRGCRAPATWRLSWNNPRVHTPERRKVWLACDEHREHLADFLGQRGFLRSVDPFDAAAPAGDGPGHVAGGPRAEGED